MFLGQENNSGKLQVISVNFQNNTINDVKQISLNHVSFFLLIELFFFFDQSDLMPIQNPVEHLRCSVLMFLQKAPS